MSLSTRHDGGEAVSATPLTDTQIDALVAERVMEWTHKPGVEGRWYEYDNLVATEDWSPSTDISDAWQVLGQFPWPKFYVRLTVTDTGNWRCDIELRGGDGPVVSAAAKDAPLAISQAALKAVRTP